MARHFRAEQDLSATVASREIPMQRGEHIGLNFQYTCTPDAFRWLLREQGGLEIVREFESPDARFLTAICRKQAGRGDQTWTAPIGFQQSLRAALRPASERGSPDAGAFLVP
jgi:hypothetical protein